MVRKQYLAIGIYRIASSIVKSLVFRHLFGENSHFLGKTCTFVVNVQVAGLIILILIKVGTDNSRLK